MAKVLYVLEDARLGGIQRRIARVASRLIQKGYECIVLAPEEDSEQLTELFADTGIELVLIKLTRLGRNRLSLLKYSLAYWIDIARISRAIQKTKPDLVHVNGVWQTKGVIASAVKRTTCIWHLNDTSSQWQFIHAFKYLSKLSNVRYITTSYRTREYYFPDGTDIREPYAIIQAPVDTSYFRRKHSYRGGDMKSGYTVGILANVNPNKGLHIFLEMVAILNKELESIKVNYRIAGPILKTQSAYGQHLRNMVERHDLQNVEFLGAVEVVPAFLEDLDIFVCTSYNESGPMAVWEAMATGLPVVSTDVGDVRHYLKGCGIVVPVGDAKSLADGVKSLLQKSKLRFDMGTAARKVAVKELDVSIAVTKHDDFYDRVLSN